MTIEQCLDELKGCYPGGDVAATHTVFETRDAAFYVHAHGLCKVSNFGFDDALNMLAREVVIKEGLSP